ncbi:Predicted transcriptional regulator [Serratia liquefaciens]|nr:Predicted transcriptional regulator [Serratia liquefaciens]
MMSQKEDLYADWHPEIIKAEIHKRGLSFRALSLKAGTARIRLKPYCAPHASPTSRSSPMRWGCPRNNLAQPLQNR